MIELSDTEKKFIKLTKGHYKDKYPFTSTWLNVMKPLFEEIYGYEANRNNSYRYTLFNKLFDIYLKIQDDGSGANMELKQLFYVAFHKTIARNGRQGIDRAISELCGLIQCNKVLHNGVKRYDLNIKE